MPEKGFAYLLRSFAQLHQQDWRLTILGDGPLREELTGLAQDLGIEDRVTMPGAVLNVDKYFSKASIFAFPSVSEGFPNALAEAMIAGLPCVSFDCDAGPRDVIHDQENGFLVGLKDVGAFTERLSQLCDSEGDREKIGNEASSVRDYYCVSSVSDDWLSFMSESMKGEKLDE